MFGKGIRIFSAFGIPVYIDLTFLIVLPLFTVQIGSAVRAGHEPLGLDVDLAPLRAGALPYLLGLAVVIGLFLSVLIHEYGHALTARRYGVRTKRITLWLLGGVAQLENMPQQRGAEAVVAIVGPIVSFALAGLFYGVLLVVPGLPLAARYVLTYLTWTNVMLAVFNLLPALPLDGGRVLRSLLALRTDPLRATQVAGAVSKVLAFALGITGVFVFHNFWLVLIAFFIYMAVNAETQQSLVEYMLRGLRVRDLMNREVVSVPPNMTVGELLGLMMRHHHVGFPVLSDGRLVGTVALRDVQGLPPHTLVEGAMSRTPSTIPEDAPALDAITKMGRSGFGRLIVVDPSGRMSGIITKTDLMRAIQVRLAATAPPEARALRESVEAEPLEPVRNVP